jgi:hypothetical protein
MNRQLYLHPQDESLNQAKKEYVKDVDKISSRCKLGKMATNL